MSLVTTIGAMDSGLVGILAALGLVMLSIAMMRRSQNRSATQRDLTRESMARLRDQKEVRNSMDELLIQLEETARRVNAQVDTRFAKLEAVIRDADQRIAQLTSLLQAPGAAPAAGGPGASKKSNAEFQPGLLGVAPPPAVNAPAPAAVAELPGVLPTTREARFERIYTLADKGSSPMAIADALSIPLGEVELILNLRKLR